MILVWRCYAASVARWGWHAGGSIFTSSCDYQIYLCHHRHIERPEGSSKSVNAGCLHYAIFVPIWPMLQPHSLFDAVHRRPLSWALGLGLHHWSIRSTDFCHFLISTGKFRRICMNLLDALFHVRFSGFVVLLCIFVKEMTHFLYFAHSDLLFAFFALWLKKTISFFG